MKQTKKGRNSKKDLFSALMTNSNLTINPDSRFVLTCFSHFSLLKQYKENEKLYMY